MSDQLQELQDQVMRLVKAKEMAEAELAEERKYSATKEDVKTLEELLEARDAEIARLREALVWYAARRTGEPAWSKERGRSVIDVDGGNLARKALEDTSHE